MKRFFLLLSMMGAVLWLGKFSAPPLSTPQLCLGRPFLVPQIVFFFLGGGGGGGCLSSHQPPGLCLSFLSFSSSSNLAWFMRELLTGIGLLCMDTLSCIHGVGPWHWPAAWSYVPVQSSSCSLRVFYRTLAVGKDTY